MIRIILKHGICQWHYTHFCNGALSVVLRLNQVSNIGYGASGTYCTDDTHIFADLPSYPLEGMIHPHTLLSDRSFDRELSISFANLKAKRPVANSVVSGFPYFLRQRVFRVS